jgi:hypothetical protein
MPTQSIKCAPYGRQQEVAVPIGGSQSSLSRTGMKFTMTRPVLKPRHYGQLVATYLFIGGIAGASQMIATTADLCDREKNSFRGPCRPCCTDCRLLIAVRSGFE